MTQTLREQLIEFHKAVNQPILDRPQVPDEKWIRLRAGLITEEFLELIDSIFSIDMAGSDIKALLDKLVTNGTINVNMPELADGMADLDYVVEGTRLEFGIDGGPIAAEVHRANMTKAGGDVSLEGKRLKPPGFKPPDIVGELEKQGWKS